MRFAATKKPALTAPPAGGKYTALV
jgi:hypothetical protein